MKPTKTYSDAQQTMWETWLWISVILFGAYFFVGTLDGSKEQYPNWIYFMLIACLNLIVCIGVGMKRSRYLVSTLNPTGDDVFDSGLLACPNCKSTNWIEGAGGGSFGNIECAKCHKHYNNLGPFGLEEIKNTVSS